MNHSWSLSLSRIVFHLCSIAFILMYHVTLLPPAFSPPWQILLVLYFLLDIYLFIFGPFFFFFFFFCSFFFFFFFFLASSEACGSSQARGWVGAIVTRLCHSDIRSEPDLQSTPQLTAIQQYSSQLTPDTLTHWARPGIEPDTSWILCCWITMGTPFF